RIRRCLRAGAALTSAVSVRSDLSPPPDALLPNWFAQTDLLRSGKGSCAPARPSDFPAGPPAASPALVSMDRAEQRAASIRVRRWRRRGLREELRFCRKAPPTCCGHPRVGYSAA